MRVRSRRRPPRRGRGGPVPGRVPGREPPGNVTASPQPLLPVPAPAPTHRLQEARGGGGNGGVWRLRELGLDAPPHPPGTPGAVCLVQEGLEAQGRWAAETLSAPSPQAWREGLEVTGGDCQGFGWRPPRRIYDREETEWVRPRTRVSEVKPGREAGSLARSPDGAATRRGVSLGLGGRWGRGLGLTAGWDRNCRAGREQVTGRDAQGCRCLPNVGLWRRWGGRPAGRGPSGAPWGPAGKGRGNPGGRSAGSPNECSGIDWQRRTAGRRTVEAVVRPYRSGLLPSALCVTCLSCSYPCSVQPKVAFRGGANRCWNLQCGRQQSTNRCLQQRCWRGSPSFYDWAKQIAGLFLRSALC